MTVLREGSGARWLIIAAGAIAISVLAVAAWFAVDIGGSAAVHDDDIFELEGDIVENGNAADGPDWGAIFNADGSVANLFGGVDAAFLMDDLSQASQVDDTIFAQSNKNNDLIATWNWDTGNNPPKDDFSNAYVWAARNRAGDLIIYTGLERLATEGESHVDVQFYREAIALDKSLPCGDDLTSDPDDGSPCEFVGEKSQGDLMISMDFEKGGRLGLLRIYKWDATIQEYDLVFDIPGEGCNPANSFPPDTVCAFNSNGSGPIQGGSWLSYDRHGNVITELEPNQFTEVGVNVSELLGFVCINSVIAKTRTSQEITAELKDFTPPQAFEVCDLDVEKTGDVISKVGDPADYTITITNSGAVTLFKQDIIDSLLGDITIGGVGQSNPFVTSNTCGAELVPGASCTINLTYTVQPGDPDPLPNTVDVVYDSEAGLQGGEASSSSSHEVNLFQPDFTITKAGDGVSKIGDQVTYTFTIANTSSFDSPDLHMVSISDDKLGDLSAQATAAGCDVLTPETSDGAGDGETCNFQVQHTIPGGASDPYTNIVTATYSPDGFPNQLTRNDSHEVNLFGPDFTITKTGDELSKIGDDVTYTFTITNTSTPDSPDLNLVSISDDKLGDLSAAATAAGCDVLTTDPPETCVFQVQHTIPGGASDPYVNEVTVTYQVDGFPNQITHSTTHSLNLFQPGVDVTKTGDALSKIGDQVTYDFTIRNTGSHDSPDLLLGSVSDTVLGDLTAAATAAGCGNLAPETSEAAGDGELCSFSVDYTIQAGDPDPLVNTVTVHYNPDGFPNDITDNASHSVNLFQPGVEVTKTGDTLSKIGDQVTYDFTITNTGSHDSPDLLLDSVSDTVLGFLTAAAMATGCGTLAPETSAGAGDGESCSFSIDYTIQGQNPDPLVNVVTVHYHPDGFPNDISDSDDHSLNLFQPGVDVTKTGDTLSKIGDQVTYDFTITNTGSHDSPDLLLDSISDTVFGDLAAAATAAGCGALAPETSDGAGDGKSCSFSVNYTIQAQNPDPLVNVVTVHYHPDGFPNDITDNASHSLNLFQPSVMVIKTGDTLSKIGDQVTYDFTILNNGSFDSPDLLLGSVSDTVLGDLTAAATAAGCGTLAPETIDGAGDGESCSFSVDYTIQGQDPDPLVNTVTVHYHPDGFPNDITDSDDHSLNLFQPGVEVTKTGDELSKIGDQVTYDFTITNMGSHDSPDLVLDSISDTVLGDLATAATAAGCGILAPETSAAAGDGKSCAFSVDYTIQGQYPDPLVNVVTVHYHPDGFPNDISDSADHSLNLFQPDYTITKDGDELSKIGDEVTYTFTIANTSSSDSPVLNLVSISDDKLGNLMTAATAAGCGTLAPETSDGAGDGQTCNFQVVHTIPGGAADPYENIVTAIYSPDGFPNQLTRSDTHSVNLFGPGFFITKTGDELSKIGDQVTYTFTITNTTSSDGPDLVLLSISDDKLGDLMTAATAAGCGTLTPETSGGAGDGEICVFQVQHTIPGGASDPYVNTVTVTYQVAGFPNQATDVANHSVNLFQPAVEVTKSGDTLSKIGDQVTYDFTITNTGSHDSPDLLLDSVSDTVLGDLTAAATAAGCGALAPETGPGVGDGQSCNFSVDYTIQGQDPDPLVNVVTVNYHPDGFPNDINDSDNHHLNLFQPGFTITKEGDELSKIGDGVTYTFTLTNTSSADSPDLNLVGISDDKLGDLSAAATAAGCDVLTADQSEICVFQVQHTIPSGASDPYVNEVTVTYQVDGFPNQITHSTTHSVNLFQPSVMVIKSGDTLSKIGDQVRYDFTIINNGSFDSPDLLLNSISDTVLGDLAAAAAAAGCGALSPETSPGADDGESCSFSVDYTVQAGDGDPLVNVVTVHYNPDGFENDITDSDDHSLNLFQPAVTVTKTGDKLSKVGDQVTYDFTITNAGSHDSPNLVLDSVSDTVLGDLAPAATAAGCGALAPESSPGINDEQSCSFSVDYTVQAGDDDPLVNTVTVHYHPDGFENDISDSDNHSLNLFQPAVTVTKTGDELSKIGDDVTYTIEVCNTGSQDSPDLIVDSVVDTVLGDLTATYTLALDPGQCESHDFPYTVQAGDDDPLVNTVTVHYHPDGFENDISDIDDHSLNLFQPGLTLTKVCAPDSASVGDTITYTIKIENTGSNDSPDLVLASATDSLLGDISNSFPVSMAAGDTATIELTRDIQSGDPDPLVNEVDALYHPDGFPNDITGAASCSVGVPTPTPTPTVVLEVTATPTPVALPEALPPTGGQDALAQDSSALSLLALIGITLIGGSAWFIWSNRRR